MSIVTATIKGLEPKYKVIENKPLLEKVGDFIFQYDYIDEKAIKEIAEEFDFSIEYARLVIESIEEGNFLEVD